MICDKCGQMIVPKEETLPETIWVFVAYSKMGKRKNGAGNSMKHYKALSGIYTTLEKAKEDIRYGSYEIFECKRIK